MDSAASKPALRSRRAAAAGPDTRVSAPIAVQQLARRQPVLQPPGTAAAGTSSASSCRPYVEAECSLVRSSPA